MAVLEELQRLSDERFLALYAALAERGFGPLDGEVARSLNFRPQAIRKLPLEKRAKRARALLAGKGKAELCYEFFGTYLVKTRKDLVVGFLDATGVPHEGGMIEGDEARPEAAKIAPTLAELDARFDPADVTLYMALCAEQWPDVPEVERAWRERAGLPVRT